MLSLVIVLNEIILETGNLDYHGIYFLNDVLLVKVFTANLSSINQPCDQDLCFNFNNVKCTIMDTQHTQLMKGLGSTNNYYMLSSSNKVSPSLI